MNIFDQRLETYSNFMRKKKGNENLQVIIRELKKFFQLGIDDYYSEEQRKKVIEYLIKEGKDRKDSEEKAVFLLFAYKINKVNKFDIEVPIIYLDETLIVSTYPRKVPDEIVAYFKPKHRQLCNELYEEALPDKESLDMFNIQIIPGYFEWNRISECLRGEPI